MCIVSERLERSTRRRAQALEISRTSRRTIMNKHVMSSLYKIMNVRKILQHYPVPHLQFSEVILNILQDCFAVIVTSDEAYFHLYGQVNKQNCRYWANESPGELHEKSLPSQKVKVCRALV